MSAIQRKFDEAREGQKAKAPTLIEALEIRVKRIEKAAPELLEACKTLLGIVRIQNGNLHEDTNKAQSQAEAAIARAEGGVE